MNLTTLFNSPFNIIIFVFGIFLFVFLITIILSKLIPLFIDSKYRSDQKVWFLKNWKWLVPVALLLIATFSLSINQLIKSSDIYKTSLRILHQSELAKDSLGEPIKLGFFIKGEVSSGGGHIMYSISGPKENGNLVADATIKNNQLEMNYIYILLKSGTKIELVNNNENMDIK